MTIRNRLDKLESAAAKVPDRSKFSVVRTIPVGLADKPPGLYRNGPDGSTAAVLVFDPREGWPVVPADRVEEWALIIHRGPKEVPPPDDLGYKVHDLTDDEPESVDEH